MNEVSALLWMVLGTIGIYVITERLLLNYVQNHVHLEVMQLGKDIKKANGGCVGYLKKRLFLCRKICWKQYQRKISFWCKFALVYQIFMVYMPEAYTIWKESEVFMNVLYIWFIIVAILAILLVGLMAMMFWNALEKFFHKKKILEKEEKDVEGAYIATIIIGPLVYAIAFACIYTIGFIPEIMKKILPHIVTASFIAITMLEEIVLHFNTERMKQIKLIEKLSK